MFDFGILQRDYRLRKNKGGNNECKEKDNCI